MRIVMAASEMFPYVKSGGLADAVGGLTKELSRHAEVIAVLPLYHAVDRKRFGIIPTTIAFSLRMGGEIFDIKIYKASGEGEVYFIYHPVLCEGGSLYDSDENDLRFGLFAHCVCRLCGAYLLPDVLHLHDWQSALAAPLAKKHYRLACRVVLTIHNLAFQGIFSKETVERLDLGWELFTMDRIEYYDQVNFLKGGIAYADAVTTVSPTYAREITTSEYGAGLESFLIRHRAKLSGILNGIDTVEFDPSHDPALSYRFDASHLQNRKRQKEALCSELSLADPLRPLFVYVGRLADQKGIGDLVELVRIVQDAHLNIVILGSGDPHHEALCRSLRRYENIRVVLKYDEELSRRIYGGGDFFLMPSRFEPCGLAQMIAMRYGAIPIVRRTGGLEDTVADIADLRQMKRVPDSAGVGIVMEHCDPLSFLHGVVKALSLYGDTKLMEELMLFNINKDFSWHRAALAYMALYRSLKL